MLILPLLLTNTLAVRRMSPVILIINPTLIHQHRKLTNLLVPNSLFDLRTQSTLKLDALQTLSSCIIIVRLKICQLFEPSSVFSNIHIPLLEFEELYLLLTSHTFNKLLLQKMNLEHNPSNLSTNNFQSLACIIPPVFDLFKQHVSTEIHLLNFRASHHTKNLLNLSESCMRTLRIISALERWRLIPLKFVQSTKLIINNLMIMVPLQRLIH